MSPKHTYFLLKDSVSAEARNVVVDELGPGPYRLIRRSRPKGVEHVLLAGDKANASRLFQSSVVEACPKYHISRWVLTFDTVVELARLAVRSAPKPAASEGWGLWVGRVHERQNDGLLLPKYEWLYQWWPLNIGARDQRAFNFAPVYLIDESLMVVMA
jgi:hypothetical protein